MGITVIHHFSGRGDQRTSFYPENPVLEIILGVGGLRTHPHNKTFYGNKYWDSPKTTKEIPTENG